MSLSSAELWQRISAQQLASPMQCRSWAAEAAAGLSASEAIDGARMASQLVTQGKLSQFQADIILSDSDEPLVRNGWRIIEPVNFAPLAANDVRAVWTDWWLAVKTPSSPAAWVRWLTAAELEQDNIREANPSLPLVLRHAQVNAANLQGVAPPEMAAGALQLTVSPLQGKFPLCGPAADQPASVEATMQMLLQVSTGLAALHAVGLAHGRVTPDRLCLDEQGNWQVLRDPLCGATLGISRPSLGLLASRLPGKLSAAHFMAPEFLLPAQAATPQTDCYALGCVAWLALTGKPPLTGKQPEHILAAHADQKLDLKLLEHVPEPLVRCLLHCLAKNPEARFSSAQQLRESLIEAQRLMEIGPVAVASPTAQVQPQAAAQPARTPQAKSAAPQAQGVAAVASTEAVEAAKPVAGDKATARSQPTAQPQPAAAGKTAPPIKPVVAATTKTGAPAQPTAETRGPAQANAPAELEPAAAAKPAAEVKPAAEAKPIAQPKPAADAKPAVEAKPLAAMKAAVPAKPDAAAKSAAQPKPATPPSAAPVQVVAQAPAATSAPAPSAAAPVAAPVAAAAVKAGGAAQVAQQAAAAQPPPSAPAEGSVGGRGSAAAAPEPASAASPARGVRSSSKGTPPVRAGVRRTAGKRKKTNAWLVPAIGAGALVALLLLVLVLSGGLGSSSSRSGSDSGAVVASQTGTEGASGAASQAEETRVADPRLEHFELVASSTPVLWAPPREPERIPLDLLPPGGQVFLSLRPAAMFSQPECKELLGLLDADLGPLWKWVADQSGVPIEGIDHVVIAAYEGQSGVPQFALRVHLQTPQSLQQLKTAWAAPTETKVGEQVLLVGGARGYYVAAQPLVDSQSVAEFLVGPVELAREAVELQGAVGPLSSQLEHLWQWTDRKAQVSLLLTPSFLFTDGRQLVEQAPERLADLLVQWLSHDMRGAMFNSSLNDEWFYELRLAGNSDRDAGAIQQKLSDALQKLPQDVESWFVSQSPHPYWRAIALRFPNMLRALAEQTRLGVENGEAIANGYLPKEAAPNLLYASWIALQPSATMTAAASPTTAAAASTQPPLTAAQILDRPITVAVDQEGIEVVLRLIGEQANEKLPAGTKPLGFELDGAAFQRSGITRNQQIRDFKIASQPVRVALTELAKRGNPVVGADLHADDQKLIWVLTETADKPGESMVSLTSREAATAAKKTLPPEFAPAQ